MIGNAAGPVMSVYLLSAGLPKRSFVGTSAWFFLLVNYMKIPLQVLAWDNIGAQALKAGACGIPFIFIGAILGVRLVNIVPENSSARLLCSPLLWALLLWFFEDFCGFALKIRLCGKANLHLRQYSRIKSKKGG